MLRNPRRNGETSQHRLDWDFFRRIAFGRRYVLDVTIEYKYTIILQLGYGFSRPDRDGIQLVD